MFPGETRLSSNEKDPHYSDFMVMESGAGWYVGTIWTSCGCARCREAGEPPAGWQEPGTRETGYFATEAEAQAALAEYKATGDLPNQRQAGYSGGIDQAIAGMDSQPSPRED